MGLDRLALVGPSSDGPHPAGLISPRIEAVWNGPAAAPNLLDADSRGRRVIFSTAADSKSAAIERRTSVLQPCKRDVPRPCGVGS